MMITVYPFKVDLSCDCQPPPLKYEKEEHTKVSHPQIIYWGIYLNDKPISYVSSKELAENTKLWIEKWLKDRL